MGILIKSIYFVLALIILLIILSNLMSLFKKSREGYHNLSPGYFPIDVDVPILHEEYPLKQHMGLSNNTYEMNSSYYPIFDSSYEQHTNNVRYWSTPNNGMCSPADFCGGLYKNKKIDVPKTPTSISLDSHDIRVNYYASHKLECPQESNI
jgi:hypothetical protein